MDLLQKDIPILAKIYEAKCFYDSQNNRIILYYKNHVTARTLVDFYNLPTIPPPNSSLYVIYDLQTGTFNVSTDRPTYTVSNSKVYVTSPINAEYDMDKVIIYRISSYELDTDIDLNHILTQLNTMNADLSNARTQLNTINTALNNILTIPYSRLYIQSTAPASPALYDSWYNTSTNELSYWNGSVWIKVDWTTWVQNDIWYRLGKLRISNGQLQISNNGTNWYQVFPALGRTVEVIADDTNTADNFKIVYLTVGQTLLVRGKNLARAAAIVPSLYIGNYYHTYPGEYWFGIFPSNITISDGYGQFVVGAGTSIAAASTLSRNFVPIQEQANEAHNWAHFSIQIVNNKMTTASVGHGSAGTCVQACIGSGTFPNSGYFLGSFCYEGTKINVDYLAITRQG
jgi:hypothetical protein